ncbi:hypothetical protein LENED_010061 [Lentinula edodes]|uniref:Uncharacterized protein n=1 Tax=Lentinula edodes TaxID=5353 RepID=A0A1Q3ELD4_LENED|nr:hypothetical protein LENED_010061 [Lentinula edodes]
MVQWPDSEAASEFSSTPFPQVLTQLQEDHDSHPKFPSMPFSQILSPPLNEDYNMFSKPTLMPFSQVLTSPYKEDYSSHSQPALMPFSQVLTLPTNEQEDPMPASTCTEVSTIFCLLFFLQIGRSDALKRLLLNPPSNHTPTASCDINDQRALTPHQQSFCSLVSCEVYNLMLMSIVLQVEKLCESEICTVT